MGSLVAVADWLGHRGEPMKPERMQFEAREATSCRGCLFAGQRYTVCDRATQAAQRAGLEHCERDGVIYVLRELDPRQITIDSVE